MNATDHAQQTALHWAAVRGSTSVADVLVEHGARVEAADVNGYRVMRRLCVSMDVQFGGSCPVCCPFACLAAGLSI